MTRLLIALLSLALLAGGCMGAEAKRAETLLRDAEQAMSDAKTLRYEVDFTVKGPGASGVVRLRGAAKRTATGSYNQVVRMSADGPGAPSFAGEVVVRNGKVWARTGGRWMRAGTPGAPSTAGLERLGPDALAQLAPFIEDVSVEEGKVVGGRPAAVVTCRIDTAALVRKAAELDRSAVPAGLGSMLEQMLDGLGDLDAVLVLDEDTHMLRAARLTLDFEAEGQSVELAINLRVTGVNRPVRIPAPADA